MTSIDSSVPSGDSAIAGNKASSRPMAAADPKTDSARRRWDRNARLYDLMTRMMESKASRKWYSRLWGQAIGSKVLEVGVGTGRSFPHYPHTPQITAVDLSSGMLSKAKMKAALLGVSVDLRQMDVQKLDFPDNTFDTVVAACTFCSVTDPVLGLSEVRRVTRPDGRIVLLEHMRHDNRFIGKLMDWMNPITTRLMGPNINRRTLDNIRKAGMEIETVENLAWGGILKFIVARPAKNNQTHERR